MPGQIAHDRELIINRVLASEELQKLIATYYRGGIEGQHLVIAIDRLFDRFRNYKEESGPDIKLTVD